MIEQVIILFILAVTSDCSVDKGILLQISDRSSCNSEKLFRNFKFRDIPQFGAMCNIPVPNEKEIDILLQNNVVPILCMGIYDVSVKLCNDAVNDTNYFKEIFPPSSLQFSGIFNKLSNSEEYSHLDKFCSSTVKNHEKNSSSSNITRFWWDVLNNKLNENESCIQICRSNEINRVHPLCSYIIWINDMILNHQKSLAETEAKNLEIPVEDILKQKSLQTIIDEPELSGYETKPPVANEMSNINIGSIDSAIQRPTEADSSNMKLNTTDQSTTLGKLLLIGINNQKEVTKPTQNISSSSITNTNTTLINVQMKEEKPTNENESKKSGNDKSLDEKTKTPPPEDIELENSKTNIGNKELNMAVDPVDDADQNNLIGEINIDSGPSDQTVGINPESVGPAQIEEDPEDEEDDRNLNSEKTGGTKSEITNQHEVPNDRGKSDKLLSHGENTVMLDPFVEVEDSHFFTYFLFISILTIMAYLAFHNKNKLLALAVEGRRSKSARRRPNSSNYSKLDCSLEEAMVSNTTASVTHVLY